MDMKNSLQNTPLQPVQSVYSREDYMKMGHNCSDSYMENEPKKDNNETNYFIDDTKMLRMTSECTEQSAEMPTYLTLSTPFYNYKMNTPEAESIPISSIPNDIMSQNSLQSLRNGYNPPNICPTTGYEAIPMNANPSFPCSCAYCMAFYQNQWYMNYYNSMAQSSYAMPTQPDPNGQLGKPFEYSFRPMVMMKPNDMTNSQCQGQQEIDQKLAHLTPIYINQPVPSNTEHFQRRTPFKKRDHNALSWLLLYLELEKDVDSPTMNARIAWINDLHHIIYTKLTSGIISRWQYEYEFSHLRNLITQKSMECDEIFRTFPRLCHCGERFKNENELNDHLNHCVELKVPWHRCLCGKLFDQHYEYFQHIFSGIILCPMAVYNLWIFFEKYRRRRYKCFCSVVFHNFWVYYVHMGECIEYQNYFQRNCYFCQESVKKNIGNNSFWSYPMVGPLKDLVLHSKIQ